MGSVALTFEFNFSLGKQCRSGSSLFVVSICIIRRYNTMVEPLRSSFEVFTVKYWGSENLELLNYLMGTMYSISVGD